MAQYVMRTGMPSQPYSTSHSDAEVRKLSVPVGDSLDILLRTWCFADVLGILKHISTILAPGFSFMLETCCRMLMHVMISGLLGLCTWRPRGSFSYSSTEIKLHAKLGLTCLFNSLNHFSFL